MHMKRLYGIELNAAVRICIYLNKAALQKFYTNSFCYNRLIKARSDIIFRCVHVCMCMFLYIITSFIALYMQGIFEIILQQ